MVQLYPFTTAANAKPIPKEEEKIHINNNELFH